MLALDGGFAGPPLVHEDVVLNSRGEPVPCGALLVDTFVERAVGRHGHHDHFNEGWGPLPRPAMMLHHRYVPSLQRADRFRYQVGPALLIAQAVVSSLFSCLCSSEAAAHGLVDELVFIIIAAEDSAAVQGAAQGAAEATIAIRVRLGGLLGGGVRLRLRLGRLGLLLRLRVRLLLGGLRILSLFFHPLYLLVRGHERGVAITAAVVVV